MSGYMSPQSLATLLSHERLQSVRALKLCGSVDSSRSPDLIPKKAVIRFLRYPSPTGETTQTVVLPNLTSLTFIRAQFDDEEDVNALMDMLSSRRNIDHLPSTVARLQELIIH
ncbi:hypothetical protein PM082_014633 [Marasmius tenuissimus]|nr:hypothetical protein PM082_014633 [Marasmius tenuissimus]